ncbi:MAG: transposase [Thiohalocapsa sp.]|nr:transposase [Thiohalocapsa sp.]
MRAESCAGRLDAGRVELAYKDYRDGRNKVLHLADTELLHRFLLHVLPKGFMRIKHFGFLANRCRRARLAQIRAALAADAARETERDEDAQAAPEDDDWPCPACREGRPRVIGRIAPASRPRGIQSG